jgi:hypothetical protein
MRPPQVEDAPLQRRLCGQPGHRATRKRYNASK